MVLRIHFLSFNICLSLRYHQGKVLEPLGAITSGSQFLEPDGKI